MSAKQNLIGLNKHKWFQKTLTLNLRLQITGYHSNLIQAIDQVLRTIRQKNVLVALKGWRNECYEIKPTFAEPPLFKMERSATCELTIS